MSVDAPTTQTTDAVGGSARRGAARVAGVAQRQGGLVVLAVVVVLAGILSPGFATVGNVQSILVGNAYTALLALGMTFVIISGGIDLSVGSLFALGGVLAAYSSQYGVVVALLVPLVVGALIGAVQGALVAWGGMAPFIVTLAGLLAVRGVVLAVTDGGSATPLITDPATIAIGQGDLLGIKWPAIIAVVLLAIGVVLLSRSRGGQAVLAVGGSENASTLMGLPVARVKFSVYVVSGVAAALSGALNAAYSSSGVPTVGVGLELAAISAVVIGGTLLTGGKGSLIGTLAGVLLLGVIQNVINQVGTLTSSVHSVVSGAFLAAVVIIQTVLSRQQRL